MCVWLLAPIVIVVILAFSGDGYLHFPPSSLSLQWFARFFGDLQWQRALLSSLIIGVIACVVSTTIGFFAAYAFLRAEFRGKKLLLSLMLTPVIVPSIITAIAMYYLAGKLGLIGNFLWLGPLPRRDRDADRAADPAVGLARRRPEPGACRARPRQQPGPRLLSASCCRSCCRA